MKMNVDIKCGDCLDLMNNIPDQSIDMVLCDLPYGTTRCKWDIVIPFEPLWEQYKRIVKPHGAIVLFGTEPFASKLRMSNLAMFKYDWIWKKQLGTGFLNANKQPLRNVETISVFYNGQCLYNPQFTSGKPYDGTKKNGKNVQTELYNKRAAKRPDNDGKRFPTQLLEYNKDGRGNAHPTQKPVALLEYLIKTYTNENETVLDNCMGSGSTGVACMNTNRNFIGIELDKQYYDIAVKRINEHDMNNVILDMDDNIKESFNA